MKFLYYIFRLLGLGNLNLGTLPCGFGNLANMDLETCHNGFGNLAIWP
jgi:hypothetical protein